MTKLSDLQPDAANANRGTAKGQKAIVGSIQRSKLGRSIVVDKNNKIIGGNKTTEAVAEVLGVDAELLVVETTGDKLLVHKRTDLDLDDPDPNNPARQLAYSDNLTSYFSFELDSEIALADLDAGFDFAAIDVTVPDLSALGVDVGRNGKEPGPAPVDKAAELREKWQTELGQLWVLDSGKGYGHRLICGDCTDRAVVDKVMGGERADIEIHDPPYGMRLNTDWSAAKSSRDFAAEKRIFGGKKHNPVEGDFDDYNPAFLFDRETPGEMFLWGADYYAEKIPKRNNGSWLIWDKRLDEAGDRMYGSSFETLWSLAKHKRDIIRIKWAGIFGTEQEPDHRRLHPTQKPVLVYEWLLSRYSKEGDISGDFYLGAGSHLLACENLGRKCRAVEIDPGYVAVTLERYHTHTGIEPELIETV